MIISTTYLARSQSLMPLTWLFITSTLFITLANLLANWCKMVHMSQKRPCWNNAVTMATPQFFFHNHPFCTPDISLNQKNMVLLSSTVGKGSLFTPLAAALGHKFLELQRSKLVPTFRELQVTMHYGTHCRLLNQLYNYYI